MTLNPELQAQLDQVRDVCRTIDSTKQALEERGCVAYDAGALYRVDTPAGVLRIGIRVPSTFPYEVWIVSIFDEPRRAASMGLLGLPSVTGGVNPHSGKWNFTCVPSFLAAFDDLMGRVR